MKGLTKDVLMMEICNFAYTIIICPLCVEIVIGKRSECPSDKLGGEICFALRVLVCVSLIYIYMVFIRLDNQYHAHSHCVSTLTLTPDIVQRKPNKHRS